MADVFISYARGDREQVERLSQVLTQHGLSVWWDRSLSAGTEFSAQIERELASAGAVLVCWSADALKSRWVKDEADEAARSGKLVAVSLDGSMPPLGYRQYHSLDLAGWGGAEDHSLIGELLHALKATAHAASGHAAETPPMPRAGAAAAGKRAAGPGRWTAAAAVVVALGALGFFLGQEQAEVNGAPPAAVSQASEDAGQRATSEQQTPAISQPASIAVLAFADLSPDGDQGYFADGLAEEILNVLSRVEGLKVASRTSAFAMRDRPELGVREIAGELGVQHVLEGSVRKAGDAVRITVQLIDALQDAHLYSETFDRALSAEKLFQVQEDIARETVTALAKRGLLPEVDRKSIQVATETRSLSAYEAYLAGHEIFVARQMDRFSEMVSLFEQSVTDDPQFARAHAALSTAYSIMPGWGYTNRPYAELSKASAERALALDPGLGMPYAVLANFSCEPVGNFCLEQEKLLGKAIAADPENPALYNFRAQFLMDGGYFSEAANDFQQCLELDPARILCRAFLMATSLKLGKLDEGYAMAQDLVDNPTAGLHLLGAAGMLYGAGRKAEARSLLSAMDDMLLNPGLLVELMFSDTPASQEAYDQAFQQEAERIEKMVLAENSQDGPPAMLYFFRQFDQLDGFDGIAAWQTFHPDFLQSPIRYEMFEDVGLPDLWRQRGFPDHCQPLDNVAPGERDYRCD